MKSLLLHFGQYFIMIKKVFSFPEKKRIFLKQLNLEIEKTGLNSLGIVTIISFFIGAVVSIQTAYNFDSPLYPKYLIGYATRESLILEFCPTMLALILAGKVGSNIASELGTMRVTEQIDALEVMGVNSIGYLIGPKIIASIFIFPIVIIYSMFFGFFGGGLVCYLTDIIPVKQYLLGIRSFSYENYAHIRYALIKTAVFAFLITSISSYFGYYLKGGALEVGKASTNAVVYSSIFILFANYILTQLLLV